MTDAFLVKQPIEPERVEAARSLFEELGRMRSDPAIELLEKEGVFTETAFLRQDEEGPYILYYIEAADGGTVQDVYHDIMADPEGEAEGMAEFIRRFTEIVSGDPSLVDGEPLYHLVNPAR